MSTDPAETIALYRYHVIADATNPRLGPAERGVLVRQLSRQSHLHPDGSSCVYSRATLDRWVRAYREQGLDGLRPQVRADLGVVRRHPELLDEAARLRVEIPARSAAQISAILQARHSVRVAERTIREHLQRRGLQLVEGEIEEMRLLGREVHEDDRYGLEAEAPGSDQALVAADHYVVIVSGDDRLDKAPLTERAG